MRRLAALVALGLLAAGACSSRPTEAEQRAAVVRDTAAAVGAYVDALDRGDLAAADELRCAAARVEPAVLDQVLGPLVARLREDLDGLRVAEVELVNRIDGVVHARVDLVGADGPVYPALVEEDGELRLCGASIDGAAERVASLKTRDGLDLRSTAPLAEVVDATPPAGFTAQAGSAPLGFLAQLAGFEAGEGRTWEEDAGGRTVSLVAVDLDTAAHARAALQALERELHDSITEIVDGVPQGTRAYRYLAGYQLLLQPPGAGPVADYVGFRWGSRIAFAYVGPLADGDGHALLQQVAATLTAAARLEG